MERNNSMNEVNNDINEGCNNMSICFICGLKNVDYDEFTLFRGLWANFRLKEDMKLKYPNITPSIDFLKEFPDLLNVEEEIFTNVFEKVFLEEHQYSKSVLISIYQKDKNIVFVKILLKEDNTFIMSKYGHSDASNEGFVKIIDNITEDDKPNVSVNKLVEDFNNNVMITFCLIDEKLL